MCFNINKRFKKLPRSLKHALLRRAPKKNYKENDLSTLRDISLLPTAYKIFAKCLVNRLLPIVVDTAVHFWQRAYIKERDRQELILCSKTALDDFKHRSSKFYALFVDFRDAFGSLDQSYLIRTLLEVGINKNYCKLIADIYQESHFQVICGNELSKEYLLTVGTKTGCPLSVVLFVIQLDRSLKEVHKHAIISLNIQDEKRISPIPVGGYADDIAFISLLEKILRDMVNDLIRSTAPSGLKSVQINALFFMNAGLETGGTRRSQTNHQKLKVTAKLSKSLNVMSLSYISENL